MRKVFISGIDTNIGKTIATGLMAGFLVQRGENVITQKIVQTGCMEESDDILVHRKMMGYNLLDVDRAKLTCPYLFKYPCSPHLAAHLEGKTIDTDRIALAAKELERKFSRVLVEGVGGLMVPLNSSMTVLDYIRIYNYPVILVSSSRLGSINHTFLSIEALKSNRISLLGIVYNKFPETDPFIVEDSMHQIKNFMIKKGYKGVVIEMDKIDFSNSVEIDFSPLFNIN